MLVVHLLKWQHQSGGRSRSWSATIEEQRLQIDGLLSESPSFRPSVAVMLADAHAIARARAVAETGLGDEMLAEACPFTANQMLSRAFFRIAEGSGSSSKPLAAHARRSAADYASPQICGDQLPGCGSPYASLTLGEMRTSISARRDWGPHWP